MPRRVSLVVLLGIIIVVVLSFGISAAAAPGEIVVPEDVAVPVESTVPVTVPPGDNVPVEGVVPPAETATPAPVAVPVETTTPPAPVDPQGEGAVPDQGVAPKDSAQGEATTAQEKTAPTSEGTVLEENAAPEENATPEGEAAPADNAAESVESGQSEAVKPEEAGQDFEGMLKEAEVADGAYKNALSEEKRLNNEITKTRTDLAGAEDSLQEAQGSLEDRASQIYKHGQDGFMSVLLEAKDFRQFANLLGSWIQVLEEDQKEVKSWRDSKDDLDQTTKELEAQLQSWQATREEAATKKEQAQTRLEDAQNFFDSLDKEAQKEIEKQRASDAALALDHAEKLIQEGATQDKPSAQEAEQPGDKAAEDNQGGQVSSGKPDESVGSEQARPDETGKADEMPPEEQQVRQVKVAQAVADTIREWPAIKEQIKKQAGQGSEEPAQKPAVMEKATEGNQNSAAEQIATAAEEQAAAQDQARQAAEQAAKEKQATEEAATRAQEAEKAKQAAEQAPAAEKEKAQSAMEEAQRQAGFAAELAAKEKQAAVDTAKQAAQRLTSTEEKSNAAQMAAEQAVANNPLAPKPGVAGSKPLPGGTGGGVLGEAKTWLGVPYDYSHMAGETRAAVDCSAFTAAVFAKFGIMLPDSPIGQLGMGTPVSGPPKAGDLVFFSEDGSGVPTHVGIANGDGTITHASNFTGEVSVTPMKYINGYMGARRLL